MRASRLLSILLLLQARGRMTAEELAREFEVSVRTIYRDVDQLSAADVPIYADRGPAGGFQLLDGYRTKLTGLSPAEAKTLSLAGLPGPAAQLGLADVLTAAQLKLSAALPERARASAGRVAARFHLDPVGWFRGADDAKSLPDIANAVWNEKCLDVSYRFFGGAVARRIYPLVPYTTLFRSIISNDGSNKPNRSRKARVSYKVQRTINASLNAATSTRAVSSNPNFVTRQKIEIIFG